MNIGVQVSLLYPYIPLVMCAGFDPPLDPSSPLCEEGRGGTKVGKLALTCPKVTQQLSAWTELEWVS
jgi:hypothetical protein